MLEFMQSMRPAHRVVWALCELTARRGGDRVPFALLMSTLEYTAPQLINVLDQMQMAWCDRIEFSQHKDGSWSFEFTRQGGPAHKVYEKWRDTCEGRLKARFTANRRLAVKRRLGQGYTVDYLCQAIEGLASSDFHNGDNDRGQLYNELTWLLKSEENMEKFYLMAAHPGDTLDQIIEGRR